MSRQLTEIETTDLALYRKVAELKKTNPGMAHHVMASVGFAPIDRGRAIATEIDGETAKTTAQQERDQNITQAVAAFLAKAPPPTNTPPAAPPPNAAA